MLTRVVLPRGAAVSVGRLFATSVPRWNPTSVEGTETAQPKTAKQAKLLFRKEQAAARSETKTAGAKAVAALEKVKNTPWHKSGKLPSRPFGIYMVHHFKSAMQPSETIGVTMTRIHTQYKSLTAEQRLPYEEKAAANLKVREAATAKIKGIKMSPNALFIKTNYKQTADSMPGSGIAKGGMVMKALAAKYKALTHKERDTHKAKAEAIRAEAQKNLAEMA